MITAAGPLADRLAALDTGAARLLVTRLDRLADHDDVFVDCVATGRPLLLVGTWRSVVYVGPYWVPGRPGCPRCLVGRTANSAFGPDITGDDVAVSPLRDRSAATWGPGVLGIVTRHVRAALTRPPGSHVVVIDGTTGTTEPQVLLPDSTCLGCATPVPAAAPRFTPAGVPLPKLAPHVLRGAELDAEVVTRDYLFPGLGLFKDVRQDLQSPFGACSVDLTTRWGRREPAIGRARTYRAGRTISVLEGLERYAGLHRGGRRPTVRAAYADIAADALYPPSLGVHPADSYALPGFRYRRFAEDTVVDWVPAYSFRRDGEILVPERSAFWGPRHDGEIAFTYDTSNGCALGNSVEEAVLHGLREVVERDSFLLTWYRRLALPEVTLAGADPRLDELLRKAALFTGFRFRCLQSTMEYGMPSFFLVAENRHDRGPATLAGSGAHPDPVQAVYGGLYELVGIILATAHGFGERRADAERMLADPALVRRMPDHSLATAAPAAREHFAFLTARPPTTVRLRDVPATIATGDTDLRADLAVAVDGMLRAGLDVLVVDQTMPELRRNGLHCTRVLVPGLVPMTFGHHNRRTVGLPRLTDGVGLPWVSQLQPGKEIGWLPHPFP